MDNTTAARHRLEAAQDRLAALGALCMPVPLIATPHELLALASHEERRARILDDHEARIHPAGWATA